MTQNRLYEPAQKWFGRLGVLHGLGLATQFFEVGPWWIRWYLADAGFVFACAYIAKMLLRLPLKYGLVAALIIACAVEAYQFSINKGDRMDVVVFILFVLGGYSLLWALRPQT